MSLSKSDCSTPLHVTYAALVADSRSLPRHLRSLSGDQFVAQFATGRLRSAVLTMIQLFLQEDIEERVVDANLAVVFDESELSKAIHEETDS